MNAIEVLGLIRRQRHDFLNHIQVVRGYLELHMEDQVLSYVKKVSEEMAVEGRIFQIPDAELAMFLYQVHIAAQEYELALEVGEVKAGDVGQDLLNQSLPALMACFKEISSGCAQLETALVRLDVFGETGQIRYKIYPPLESEMSAREIVVTR
jgi:hypothetical protein